MIDKWARPTDRNRLRIAAILGFGAIVLVVVAGATTTPNVTGIIATMVAWITSGVCLLTVWIWLYGYGDRWRFPLDITGILIVAASLATALMQEAPMVLLLAPFYLVGRSLATRWERNRIAEWEQRQRAKRTTPPPLQLRDDPLIGERDRTRQTDANTEYPATLRELRARLRRSEGDPWA